MKKRSCKILPRSYIRSYKILFLFNSMENLTRSCQDLSKILEDKSNNLNKNKKRSCKILPRSYIRSYKILFLFNSMENLTRSCQDLSKILQDLTYNKILHDLTRSSKIFPRFLTRVKYISVKPIV